MKKKSIFIGSAILLVLIFSNCKRQSGFPKLKGPYLGQKPPGITPEIFRPGIISTDAWEFSITFSKNGKELLFTRRKDSQQGNRLLYMKMEGGRWSLPHPPPFALDCRESEPNFSPDGTCLFYNSRHPLPQMGY